MVVIARALAFGAAAGGGVDGFVQVVLLNFVFGCHTMSYNSYILLFMIMIYMFLSITAVVFVSVATVVSRRISH